MLRLVASETQRAVHRLTATVMTQQAVRTASKDSRAMHSSVTSLSDDQKQKLGSLWHLGKLNHVAIACHNLEQATALYRDVLGAKCSAPQKLPDHGVYTVFVELGNTKLELLSAIDEKSPIAGFLAKNRAGGMHHICIEVDNLDEAIKTVRAKKIRTITNNSQIGAHGKPVIFLHPKDCNGVLVELEQA